MNVIEFDDIVLKGEETIFAIEFNPQVDIFAIGTIKGNIYLYRYDLRKGTTTLAHKVAAHCPHSVRGLSFTDDGKYLISCSQDGSIKVFDTQAGSLGITIPKAHNASINTLLCKENRIASGDDDGNIIVWDLVSRTPTGRFSEHHDFISAFLFHSPKNLLIAGSGDGCVSGWDLRQNAVDGISENFDEEILTLQYVNNISNVICGTQDGHLPCFKVGEWEEPVKLYPGLNKIGIECLSSYSKKTLVAAMSDGFVRAFSVKPFRWAILGEHENVDKVVIDRTKTIAASSSSDGVIKFWGIGQLAQTDDDQDFEVSEDENLENLEKKDEDEDDEEEEEDEDEDEDEEDSEMSVEKEKETYNVRSRNKKKNEFNDFFDDL